MFVLQVTRSCPPLQCSYKHLGIEVTRLVAEPHPTKPNMVGGKSHIDCETKYRNQYQHPVLFSLIPLNGYH